MNKIKHKKQDLKNKISIYQIVGILLIIIQTLLSILFINQLHRLNLIPTKYMLPIIIVLYLILVIAFFTQLSKNGKSLVGKTFSTVMIGILSFGLFYANKINAAMNKISVDDVANKTLPQAPFNVYISGIDVYGDLGTVSRSDVNIIATINPLTNEILLTTTPRDYYVPITGISNGQRDKLTHAGNYGVKASMHTLEELYDIKIDYYIRINFTSLINIVNELGGIDVISEYDFSTGEESGNIMEVKKGLNHFDGKEALAFSRERKNLDDGDNQRGKNQEAVISALIKKLTSPSIIIKASSIIDSLSDNIETNLPTSQIQAFIKMQLENSNEWVVHSVAAEGIGDEDYCYSAPGDLLYVTIPDDESISKITEQIKVLLNKRNNDKSNIDIQTN